MLPVDDQFSTFNITLLETKAKIVTDCNLLTQTRCDGVNFLAQLIGLMVKPSANYFGFCRVESVFLLPFVIGAKVGQVNQKSL